MLQLVLWGLRGVSRVILANNPLSGALIMAALCWESRWKALLGTLGLLASTFTAVIMEQDRLNDMNNDSSRVYKHKNTHIYMYNMH